MQKPTVLVIEDDAIARLNVTRILQGDERLEVLDAGTAQEALDLSARFQLDLIVADIMLGDTDGVTVVQQVLSRQDANVVFMTAVSDHKMRTRAEELKPVLFLQKPIDERALRRAIDESLSHRGESQFADMNANFILDTLYDTAQIGMCITDENRRFVRVNRAYCANYGYPAQQLIGNEFTMVLPPEDREYAATVHDEFVAGTLVEMPGRWRVQDSAGEIKHIYVTAGRMIGRDGRTYKVTTVSDITSQLKHEHELEAALEEKQVLLREVHHRVKNNLNTLSSLLHLQRLQNSTDQKAVELLTVTINRVKTMSSIYERLHHADQAVRIKLNDYLSDLAQDLVETSEQDGEMSITCNIDPLEVDLDNAISNGLIVNELVTNCLKHACETGAGCQIALSVTKENDQIVITVQDNGPGLPEGFSVESSTSLGLQLIQALVGQKKGTLVAENNGGARFTARLKYTPA